MKKLKLLTISMLSLMIVVACFALTGCFEPEPEPEPDPTPYYPITFVVSFNLNYTGAPEAATQKVVRDGHATAPETNPTRTGYNFVGWYNRASGGSVYNFETSTITADTTVYARWEAVKYTITFNYNYTGAPAATTQEVAYDSNLNKPTDPERTGYVFAGWYDRASGGNAITFPLKISGAATLYAHWTEAPVDPSPSA